MVCHFKGRNRLVVLRGVFGPKTENVKGGWRKLIMRSFIICTLWEMSLEKSNQGGRDG